MSLSRRDRQLRQALDFALSHTTDETAIGAIFGALGSMVETQNDAEALQLAQRGILALLGGFPPGSVLHVGLTPIDTEGSSTEGGSDGG